MLSMACCLSSHLRFNHPGKEKKHSAKQGPCGPCGPCGPFSIVINFVSLAVLFSGYISNFRTVNIMGKPVCRHCPAPGCHSKFLVR